MTKANATGSLMHSLVAVFALCYAAPLAATDAPIDLAHQMLSNSIWFIIPLAVAFVCFTFSGKFLSSVICVALASFLFLLPSFIEIIAPIGATLPHESLATGPETGQVPERGLSGFEEGLLLSVLLAVAILACTLLYLQHYREHPEAQALREPEEPRDVLQPIREVENGARNFESEAVSAKPMPAGDAQSGPEPVPLERNKRKIALD